MATLPTKDLHSTGGQEIWPWNQILTSISSRIPVLTGEDGCPLDTQQFSQSTHIMQKLVFLWES